MNETPTALKAVDAATLQEMEHAVEEAVAEAAAPQPKIADFRQRDRGSHSVAEQMLGIADSIKAVHKEIDQLQEDVLMRLTMIRKKLGGKA